MKTIKTIFTLAIVTLLLFGIIYPLTMVGLGQLIASEGAEGKPIYRDEVLVGFENIGQQFNGKNYFWSRPSAVDYDASSTGGSNLGPTNPVFLEIVQNRIDTLLAYHPGLQKSDIPVELITASGSGLDPHISKDAALIQVERLSKNKGISKEKLVALVEEHVEQPFLGIAGPGNYVNVLTLNLSLDEMN